MYKEFVCFLHLQAWLTVGVWFPVCLIVSIGIAQVFMLKRFFNLSPSSHRISMKTWHNQILLCSHCMYTQTVGTWGMLKCIWYTCGSSQCPVLYLYWPCILSRHLSMTTSSPSISRCSLVCVAICTILLDYVCSIASIRGLTKCNFFTVTSLLTMYMLPEQGPWHCTIYLHNQKTNKNLLEQLTLVVCNMSYCLHAVESRDNDLVCEQAPGGHKETHCYGGTSCTWVFECVLTRLGRSWVSKYPAN